MGERFFVRAAVAVTRRSTLPAFALASLTLLTGCIVGYEKPDPALEVAGKYTYGRGKPDAALPSLDWWRTFRSPELTALVEAAQTANLDVAIAVARIAQADAQARISGAALLPTVEADGSATRSRPSQRTSSSSTTTLRGGSIETTNYNASLSASYQIDFWGQNRAALLASQESAIGSRFSRDVVTLTAVAAVANTYFEILSTQDRLRIAHENIAAADRVLGLVRQRFMVGTASQLDVAQQESLAATQRAAVPPLEIILRQNRAALAVLIGRAPENVTVRGGRLSAVTVPRVTPGLPSDILVQRPDIRLAEAQLSSSNYSVESARAAFFPNITLTGTRGFQSAALASLFGPGAWYYTMAASLTQPVFDGFLRQGELELAQGRQQEFLQTYRKAVLSAFSDVEQALIAVEQQATRERLQGEVVRAARQAFELSEQRLREGTVDLVTVLTTEQTLFQAQDTLAQIRFARLQAVVSLYQALGGGWPPKDTIAPVSQ
jgi:NodT family efflux transporter outer membrane factor (OMF) lipoprotein